MSGQNRDESPGQCLRGLRRHHHPRSHSGQSIIAHADDTALNIHYRSDISIYGNETSVR